MAVRKILTISKYEKLLRTKSEPVARVNRETKALLKDIRDTMEDAGNAIGLAAPQIGVMKRVFAFRRGIYAGDEGIDDGDLEIEQAPEPAAPTSIDTPAVATAEEADEDEEPMPPPYFMINPEIVEKSDEVVRNTDGCLSVPGLLGYTNRYKRIRVKYLDERGKPQDEWFEDWDARMIQHEYDHLDGILFMDRLSTIDDLYVITYDEDGKMHRLRYKDVVTNAKKAAAAASKVDEAPRLP
jgi:peptide deformylase